MICRLWFILYLDPHGVWTLVKILYVIITPAMLWTLQSPIDLHHCINSFVTDRVVRVNTHTHTRACTWSVCRHLQIRRCTAVCAVLLVYAPKLVCTWYRPRDRITRFDASSSTLVHFLLLSFSFASSGVPFSFTLYNSPDHANPGTRWFVFSEIVRKSVFLSCMIIMYSLMIVVVL